MLGIRVMPCLLLKGGRLVKTVRFKDPAYVGDPVNAVRIYNDKEVDDLIVLDIDAGRSGAPIQMELVSRIASECFMPMAYGGGIRTLEQIKAILAAGIEKVSLNTQALDDEAFVARAAERFGSQSVVISIDARRQRSGRYHVHAHGGRKSTGRDAVDFAVRMQEMGAGEILLNSIDRDGVMEGYELDLIRQVSAAVTVPVIACGGAGRLEHLRAAVVEGGAAAVAIGSMAVYQGRTRAVLINFPSAAELKTVFM